MTDSPTPTEAADRALTLKQGGQDQGEARARPSAGLDREAVARIIDPDEWRRIDARLDRNKQWSEHERRACIKAEGRRSLGKADDILALASTDRVAELEGALKAALERLEQFAKLDDQDRHTADNAEDKQFYVGRANGLRTAINYVRGCGAIDCVNGCDGDFTHETCPDALLPSEERGSGQ